MFLFENPGILVFFWTLLSGNLHGAVGVFVVLQMQKLELLKWPELVDSGVKCCLLSDFKAYLLVMPLLTSQHCGLWSAWVWGSEKLGQVSGRYHPAWDGAERIDPTPWCQCCLSQLQRWVWQVSVEYTVLSFTETKFCSSSFLWW